MGVSGTAEENSASTGKDLSNQTARDAQQSTPANQTAPSATSPAKQEVKAAKQEAAQQEAAKATVVEQTSARNEREVRASGIAW